MRIQLRSALGVLSFMVFTGLLIAIVGLTFTRAQIGAETTYSADFSNASGLKTGDDVRSAGVTIGRVQSISLAPQGSAVVVQFTTPTSLRLPKSTTVTVRYANLIGDQYLDVEPGTGGGSAAYLAANAVLPMSQTTPALDLDSLFQGFGPLMQALNPDQVNQLSLNLLNVLNGQAGAVSTLLQQVGTFTNGLASRSGVIEAVIKNLSGAVTAVDARGSGVTNLLDQLSSLMKGLAQDKGTIATSIGQVNQLTMDAASLIAGIRPGLKSDLNSVGQLASAINANVPLIERVLDIYPETLQKLGRGGAYGSFFNFYLCSVREAITIPGAPTVYTPNVLGTNPRCQPQGAE